MSRVSVPRVVHDGIMAVRASGLTNMLDHAAAAETATALGYPDAAAWILQNKAAYARAVLHGIERQRD